MRWDENYHLFILGAMSFAFAWFGRVALRSRWRYWVRLHLGGMGLSYIRCSGQVSYGAKSSLPAYTPTDRLKGR